MTTNPIEVSVAEKKQLLSNFIGEMLRANPEIICEYESGASEVDALEKEIKKILTVADLEKVPLTAILKKVIRVVYRNVSWFGGRKRFREQWIAPVMDLGKLLVDQAMLHGHAERSWRAFYIFSAVAESYVPLYRKVEPQRKDDSREIFKREIYPSKEEPAYQVIDLIDTVDIDSDEAIRKAVVDLCEKVYNAMRKEKNDLQSECLLMMSFCIKTSEEIKRFILLCDHYLENTRSVSWHFYTEDGKILKMLEELFSGKNYPDFVREFLLSKPESNEFVDKGIELLVEAKEFKRAFQLCRQRLRQKRPVSSYKDNTLGLYISLLEAGLGLDDKSAIRESCYYLLSEIQDIRYYEILRDNTPEADWPRTRRTALYSLKYDGLAGGMFEIYMLEKDWTGLASVIPIVDLRYLTDNDELLWVNCREVFEKHFDEPVWDFMKIFPNHHLEKLIVAYLGRMKERIGANRIADLAILVKAKHPDRREFIKRLEQI